MPLLFAIIATAFLIAPLFIVVPMSFSTSTSFAFPPEGYWLGYYRAYFASEDWLIPTANSIVIAFCAMMVIKAVGHTSDPWGVWAVKSFIYAVTIIVVAIPEGLPLAVTISLPRADRRYPRSL